jgi:hypothetical protein
MLYWGQFVFCKCYLKWKDMYDIRYTTVIKKQHNFWEAQPALRTVLQSYKYRYNRTPLRFWPAKFSSERIRTSVSYSNDSRLADIMRQAPCPCQLTCRAGLSARLTRFFTSQKLKDDITTSYEFIYLQNNCHQLISRLRMSGAISSCPPMPSWCGKRRGTHR